MLPLLGNFRSLPAVLAGVNEIGRTLLDGFAELTCGRDAAGSPGEVELLLTLDEGRGKEARKWAQEEIDLEPPPGGSPPRIVAEARFLAERLRELVASGEAERGEIVVLLRAFTHVDAYEEALRRAGLRPFVVGGAATGPSSRSRTWCGCSASSPTRSTTSTCSGRSPASRNAVSPDALWLLRRAATGDERAGPPGVAAGRVAIRRPRRAPGRPSRRVARGDPRGRTRRACGASASCSPSCAPRRRC